ncbi:hypothetical protein [Trichormus azollae]|jgi:hypothetical protein|uniref:hypothetical protein n=1 Tax=Trichormus azollae TaxID=1164 RepID=UPI0001957A2C|nr:hypothetical protein [Trichormus azollae]
MFLYAARRCNDAIGFTTALGLNESNKPVRTDDSYGLCYALVTYIKGRFNPAKRLLRKPTRRVTKNVGMLGSRTTTTGKS